MQSKIITRPQNPRLALAPIKALIPLLLCAVASQNVWAALVTMPAGSTVWMELTSNACDPDGDADCTGSNQLGANPAGGIAPITFIDGTTSVTGSAEAFPDLMRVYLLAATGSFMYVSMLDTYTVQGTASGTFEITVHFELSGMATSRPNGPFEQLIATSAGVEIGTFNPSTDPAVTEQFRVTPFTSANTALVNIASESHPGGSGTFQRPVGVGTSYTRTVSVGDIFDLAYGLTGTIAVGELDLRNTAAISFDLPQGVYLTSAQGGTFGIVPVPAAAWLFASGIAVLGALRRRA